MNPLRRRSACCTLQRHSGIWRETCNDSANKRGRSLDGYAPSQTLPVCLKGVCAHRSGFLLQRTCCVEQPFAVTGAEGKPGSGNRCGFIQHVNSVIDPSLGPAVTLALLAFPKCEGTGWHGSCAELETCVCVSHGLYHFQPRRVLYWQNTRTPVIALFIDLQLENRPWIIVITHYYCLYYCAHRILVWFCISNACLSVFMCSYVPSNRWRAKPAKCKIHS